MSFLPPKNFRFHSRNMSRSSAPSDSGINFVASKGFRKFICLGSFPSYISRNIAKSRGIVISHYPVPENIGLCINEAQESIYNAIDFIVKHDEGSRLYLFDDTGYSQVGVVCAILRRIEGWSTYSAIEEFISFNPVENNDANLLQFICEFEIGKWERS